MSIPVDLTNLYEITGNDAELEAELFAQFNEAFTTGIAALEANLTPGDAEKWQRHAHALKGVALNLGASALGELCKTAQHSEAAASNKPELLAQIRHEYQRVQEFLKGAGLDKLFKVGLSDGNKAL